MISVSVSEGLTWKFDSTFSSDFFSVNRHGNRLKVTTTHNGDKSISQIGTIPITVYDANNKEIAGISGTIPLTPNPLNGGEAIKILTVDNKTSFDEEVIVPNSGGMLNFTVNTESNRTSWVAKLSSETPSWFELKSKTGTNGSVLQLSTGNEATADQKATVTVFYDGDNDGVEDEGADIPKSITINIFQPKDKNATIILSTAYIGVLDNNSRDVTSIVHITPTNSNIKKYKAVMTGNVVDHVDGALLVKAPGSYTSTLTLDIDKPLELCVFATGRGISKHPIPDLDRTGTIKLTPLDANGLEIPGVTGKTISVEVHPSNVIAEPMFNGKNIANGSTWGGGNSGKGCVKIYRSQDGKYFYLSDRNQGAFLPTNTSPVIENFAPISNATITKDYYGDKGSVGHWISAYWSWVNWSDPAIIKDGGWMIPKEREWKDIIYNGKIINNVFFVSSEQEEKKGVRIYSDLPFVGMSQLRGESLSRDSYYPGFVDGPTYEINVDVGMAKYFKITDFTRPNWNYMYVDINPFTNEKNFNQTGIQAFALQVRLIRPIK